MADFIPNICGDSNTYIPTAGCTECDKIYERLDNLEECCDEVKETLDTKLEASDLVGGDGITITIDEETGKPVISTSKEELLSVLGYEEIELAKTDENGEIVIAHVLGYITTEQLFTWTGLDPIETEVGTDIDPLQGVSAIGCNDAESEIELLQPVISGVTNWTVPLNGNFDPLFGISATDIDGLEIDTINTDWNADNLATAGDYEITYWVVDANGNYASETATITVLAEEFITRTFTVISANDTFDEEIEVYYIDEDGSMLTVQGDTTVTEIISLPSVDNTLESTMSSTDAMQKLPSGIAVMGCDDELIFEQSDSIMNTNGECVDIHVEINGFNLTATYIGSDDEDSGGNEEVDPTETTNEESEGNE